ncbi:hypothetical protein GIB67_022986 [Kingdonia uniflora]|uniref:Uncharacterized protein n=1 Tax=Kingdonia uniflora TaxID=39325 RepID=A0A7J7P2E7_9MAGN|nr:hypothetical protein GIB67_022986 [Kingdonia uniflora]
MVEAGKVENHPSKEIIENVVKINQEILEEALSRHRKEIAQLQNKETAMKKAVAKGSKAQQMAKKK